MIFSTADRLAAFVFGVAAALIMSASWAPPAERPLEAPIVATARPRHVRSGELYRSEDWNALVDLVDEVKARLSAVEARNHDLVNTLVTFGDAMAREHAAVVELERRMNAFGLVEAVDCDMHPRPPTARLIGRYGGGSGALEQITVGTGLSLTTTSTGVRIDLTAAAK